MTTKSKILSGTTIGVLIDEGSDDSGNAGCNFVRKFGGNVIVCHVPPESPSPELIENIQRLITGGIDLAIFLTVAGTERITGEAFRTIERQRVVDSLSDIITLAGRARVADYLRELGVEPSIKLEGSGSWRDVLTVLDRHFLTAVEFDTKRLTQGLANLNVAVEETHSLLSLAAGLESRGSKVLRLPTFGLPIGQAVERGSPVEAEFEALFASAENDDLNSLLFTSPDAVAEFVNRVKEMRSIRWRDGVLLDKLVVAVGANTQEVLADHEIQVDVVATEREVAAGAQSLANRIAASWQQKRKLSIHLSGPATSSLDKNAPWYDSPFMKACRGEPTDVTPIWMMRQAGRYMKEYRDVRQKVSFLELCANPQLCSEVMCTAVKRLGVDAAIIFSDLLPILVPMGCDLEFVKGDGPVIHNPIRQARDVDRIKPLETIEPLDFVMQTVKQTRADLPDDLPLIGFAGSPFTLASYMIEGGSSRNYAHTKTLMYGDPGAWEILMQHLVSSISIYLNGQIEAGAQCVQLFDSWAGCLSFEDYRNFALPHVKKIISSLPAGVPVINFATGNPALLPLLAEAPAGVIGIDWRIRLDDAWQAVGYDRSVQGNLDPAVLLTNPQEIRRQAQAILDQAAGRPGHVFNLGHGILPQTPVENAIALVDAVHELSSK